MGLFKKIFSREKKETLDKGLEKTKQGVFEKIKHAVAGKSTVDDDVLDNLEEVFVTSDVGVDTTVKIIDRLQARVARDKYVGTEELNELLCDEISQMLADNNNAELEDFTVPEDSKPYVIMVVGVNGVGKTTTIGKLAYQFKQAGNKVVLGAADTYRAAADELGDSQGVDLGSCRELLGLLKGVLARRAVEHEQHLLRSIRQHFAHGVLDLGQLVHQAHVVVQAAGGVDDDDVGILCFGAL